MVIWKYSSIWLSGDVLEQIGEARQSKRKFCETFDYQGHFEVGV